MNKNLFWTALVSLSLGLLPSLLQAQSGLPDAETIAGQNLRGYTHMFIAYFIAWALILGWVISIARRLRRMEKALQE
jgi:CcmD family protein